jgi:copper chaperone CopZ
MNTKTSDPSASRLDAGVVAQFGALASAVVASACCWLPLLLIAVGVSGGALSATFEAWRPVLLPVTFVLLGAAFYFTYRKPKVLAATSAGTAAAGEGCCSVPEQGAAGTCCPPENAKGVTLKKVNKVMLWVVTVFVLAFAFFPNYVGYLLAGGDTLAARTDLGKVVVKIDGMTCEACAANIENALRKVPGVAAAEVSYERREAVVGVPKDSQPPREAILAAVAGAGNYQGRFADHAQWTLAIEGMTCEGCATRLQAALTKVPGVTSASVSYEEGRARVTAGSSVSEETLRKTVSEAGYTVTSATRDGQATRSGDQR